MTTDNERERAYALQECHRITASEEYFNARPQIDSADRRRVFEAGFDKGYATYFWLNKCPDGSYTYNKVRELLLEAVDECCPGLDTPAKVTVVSKVLDK